MPQAHFHWHRDAHVFAGTERVTPFACNRSAIIPAEPPRATIEGLHAALKDGAGFCVSDRPLPDLAPITASKFATLTGGSSGTPKVILRSQASWIKSFDVNAALFGYSADDSIAVLGGLAHSLALYGLLEGVHHGLSVRVLCALGPAAQSAALQRYRCTILYATPTQLRLLPNGSVLRDVRVIVCGGGALGDATRQHIKTLCPNAQLHVFYGAAETSFVTLGAPDTPAASAGRPYPGVELAVRNADGTARVSGTGEIWLRSPYVFERYIKGDSLHTKRDGDWLTVGEQGTLDAAGYLYLRGRAGRSVTIADQTVFPEELEMLFSEIAGVGQCAVLVRPDSLRGHHLIAVIEGPEDTETKKLLRAYCKANALVVPRAILFVSSFPLLPSGKPDLPRIAAMTGSSL